jgi:hypothetical protein
MCLCPHCDSSLAAAPRCCNLLLYAMLLWCRTVRPCLPASLADTDRVDAVSGCRSPSRRDVCRGPRASWPSCRGPPASCVRSPAGSARLTGAREPAPASHPTPPDTNPTLTARRSASPACRPPGGCPAAHREASQAPGGRGSRAIGRPTPSAAAPPCRHPRSPKTPPRHQPPRPAAWCHRDPVRAAPGWRCSRPTRLVAGVPETDADGRVLPSTIVKII